MALLCYLVTALLLFLIGDVFDIDWLQLHKETYFRDGSLKEISASVIPCILALPVYFLVSYKMKKV
ncbi:hypothetical protein J7Q84_09145 [Bacillus sp. 165]|nr:hypothetical protein [Bacillus sp. 165]